MRPSRSQILPLLLLLSCLFGCKGMEVFRVATALAFTAAQVAQVAATASAQEQHAKERHAREEAQAAVGLRQAEEDEAIAALTQDPSRCTEVRVEVVPPPPPGAWVKPRAVECNGIVMIQDSELHWRRYEGEFGTETVIPPL
jgi:hypothetical protein